MDILQFRSLAISGAESYYRFLEKNGRGRVTVRVQHIEAKNSGFLLSLSARFSVNGEALDSLIFSVQGREYTASQINPVSYDRQKATLFIRPSNQRLANLFSSASADDVLIHSDLKFLVRRVHDWYDRFGTAVHLPRFTPSVPLPSEFFGSQPTPEQRAAINGALTQPFSYVWGAPGTGKTRCVLANCIIAYLLAGKKVTLVAPTNNAVEQMLFGLMPVLEDAGFSPDRVLRLGIPSVKFSAQYPTACESSGLGSRMASIERQIKIYRDCLVLREEAEKLASVRKCFPVLIGRAARLRETHMQYSRILQEQQDELVSQRAQKALSAKKMGQLLAEIESLQRSMHTLRSTVAKLFSLSSYKENECKLDALYQSLEKEKALSRSASDKADEAGALIRRYENSRLACISDARSLRDEMRAAVSFAPPLLQVVSSVDMLSASSDYSAFFSAFDSCVRFNAQRQEQYGAYSTVSDSELYSSIDALEQEYADLEAADLDKYEGKSVVAATIDRYISTFSPDTDCSYSPDHIFMDEAGYCCLIKSAILLASGVPVTLLGDHMQLPPICEMNDSSFSGDASSVFLWAQSSIYLEDIFVKSSDQMLSDYFNGVAPTFSNMPKYDLTMTHRFGSAIASVLADTVYSSDFCSANPDGTSILVLDAPRIQCEKRQSVSEADAIGRYLSAVSSQDFAILTPYRSQVSLLSRRFPDLAKNGQILTVHASQGREWDTLIFSPVDNSPGSLWFSDSLSMKSRGKSIINTAVSRAKRQLVLVCDRSFWESNRSQLISRLIAAGH